MGSLVALVEAGTRCLSLAMVFPVARKRAWKKEFQSVLGLATQAPVVQGVPMVLEGMEPAALTMGAVRQLIAELRDGATEAEDVKLGAQGLCPTSGVR